MFLNHRIQQPNYFPDEGVGLGIKPEVSDSDTAVLDDLLDKTPLPEKEDEEEEVEEEKEEKPDEKLLEDDDEEIKPDDLLVENARAIDFKKIKEKYSDFAKTNEYKELRNSYHREAQYTELFPTIEDAREAVENNETYTKLNSSIIEEGNPLPLLEAIKEASPDALKKVSVSFLDNLYKVDPSLFQEAVNPLIRRVARQINIEATKHLRKNPESDEGLALRATARNIMNYFFEDPDLVDKGEPQEDPKITEKEKQLSEREKSIETGKFQTAANTVGQSAFKHLDRLILEGLDPDNKFSDFVRDSLVEKIGNEVKSQLNSDRLHIRRMDSLWKLAKQSDFSRESLSRLVSAYLERARPIISTVRSKYRTTALKNTRRASDDDTEERDTSPRIRSKGVSGRAPSNDGKVNIRAVDSKKIDYNKTSDLDILDGKIALKGSK